VIDLDDMLETAEAAKWLRMRPRDLLAKTKGRKPEIPAFRINSKVVRFHPRTIVCKLAADAGLSPELISASLNLKGSP